MWQDALPNITPHHLAFLSETTDLGPRIEHKTIGVEQKIKKHSLHLTYIKADTEDQ